MARNTPTLQEWKELYKAAIEFRDMECWNWMDDNQIFGIQNPETGKIGYCCIMGRMGEHYGIGVYKGTHGLSGLLKIMHRDEIAETIDALHIQNCLMVSYEDRKYLEKKDQQIIKKLGMKFRGCNAWPLFRDFTSGYQPWFITSDDAKFLPIVLKQSMEVASRVKDNPKILVPNQPHHFFGRVLKKDNGKDEWVDEWLDPYELDPIDISDFNVTTQKEFKDLEEIGKNKDRCNDIWEIGAFYSPQGVQERSERPYYPKVVLFLDHESGLVLSFSMAKESKYKSECFKKFYELISRVNLLPKSIVSSDEEILDMFFPITEKLDIELFEADYLDMFEEAKHGFTGFIRR